MTSIRLNQSTPSFANPAWNDPAVAAAYDLSRPAGAAALDAMIRQQAAMIAYVNDFRLMLYLTLLVMPLLLLIPTPRQAGPAQDAHAVLD